MTGDLRIVEVPFDGCAAQELIAELQQEYVERYGGPDETPVDGAQFAAPAGAFLIGNLNGVTIGCAGLRRHDEQAVELKRMYVRSNFRRQGLASALLIAVESRARKLGYRQLILETGLEQPEAIGLYLARGYSPMAGYGTYQYSPDSRSFVKTL